VEQNRTGAAAIAGRPLPPALSPDAVRKAQTEGGLVLDVRETAPFGAAHIPGSLNVGLGGQFASWCGSLVDLGAPLVIVADDEAGVTEAVTRLSRVGLDNISGYLQGGIAAWDRVGQPLARTPHIPVDELRAQIREARPGLQVLDVRRPAEYATGHVPGARLVPLDTLEKQLATLGLDRARPTPVICAGGYRSSAAASLLERHGFGDLYNVVGGTSAWIAAGYEVEGG
jgi:hydroxyacylglutathione hydrolase